MTLVDVHAHLDYKDFDEDRLDLIQKLKEQKIITLTNTLNPKNYEETKELFKGHSHIKVCPGLYPQEAEKLSEEEFNDYLNYLKEHQEDFIAIGEVGLDKHNTKDEDVFNLQKQRFTKLVELACEIKKPMLIHTRKAEFEVLEILEQAINKTGFKQFDLHCFMGKKKYISKIKELGIFCSIPLIVLNTQSFQILVEQLPTRQLLVETDSPYLNPTRERNSPLNIPQIYERIAQIKGYDKKEIENIIYRNYMRFTN